jgi:hypothetical protein
MRTKVAFLFGKSPVESDKPNLQNAAFPPFHCNCFITLYICFVASCTSGTVIPWHIVNADSALSLMGIPPIYNTAFLKKKASCLLHLHVP